MHAISFSRAYLIAPSVVIPPDPPFTGQTFFMSPSGNDINNGTSELTPKFTFGSAAGVMSPGDRCFLRGGNFLYPSYQPGFAGGTSWALPKLFINYPGELPVIRPQGTVGSQFFYLTGLNTKYIIFSGYNSASPAALNMKFDGTDFSGNLFKITYDSDPATSAAHHIRLQNLDIGNPPGGQGVLLTDGNSFCELLNSRIHHCGAGGGNLVHGVYWQGDHGIIAGCEIDHNGAYGMQMYHDLLTATVNDNLCYGNVFHHNSQNSSNNGELLVAAGNNNTLYNNVVYGGGNNGIEVYNRVSTTNNLVYFNTVYGCVNRGIKVYAGCTGSIIRNNVSYLNGTNYEDLNITVPLTIEDHNSRTGTDPQFVAPGSGNFHLQSGSPLRGQGVAIAGITTDFDGVTRNNPPDIGAYQYV